MSKNNPSRDCLSSDEIIAKHLPAFLKEAESALGDTVCNVIDEALKGVYVDILPTKEGLSITVGHDVVDSESYGSHFLEVDLETLIAGSWPDNPEDARRSKEDILILTDKLAALVEQLRSYEWPED